MQPASRSAASPVVIATATDARYLPWAATALLSAARATSRDAGDIEAVLMYRDVAAADLDRLADALRAAGARLRPVSIEPDALGPLPSGANAHGGDVGCARFLLPELMPDVDRVLYIDGDTLVQDSVAPLCATDLNGHPIGAVKNIVLPHHAIRIRELGLDSDAYFNSGVLLMDLAEMRRKDSARELLDALQDFGERLMWVDQDALNLVFADDWLPLPIRWNCQNSLYNWRDVAVDQLGEAEVVAATEHPGIVHFEGPSWAKPWHYLSPHRMAKTYREAAALGPFGPPELVDATLGNRLLMRVGGVRWAVRAHDRLLAWGLHHCAS